MKRNWIKVRNGLLDPKHVEKLGFCPTLLYLYILDVANWETGSINGWKDREVAIDLGVPTWKVKDYRNRLTDAGYISCQRVLYGQNITIDKWMTPFDNAKPNVDNTDICKENGGQIEVKCRSNRGQIEKTAIGNVGSFIKTSRHQDIKTNTGAQNAPEDNLFQTEVIVADPKKIGDVIDGMLKYAKPPDPASRFPEEVREVIREFIRLWKVEPLSGQMGDWITSGRELNQACGEYGLRAMKQAQIDYNNNPSYMVSRPGSVVKAVQAAAAKMRQSTPQDKVCTWCKGTGVIVKPSDPIEYRPDGGIRNVEAPCPRCGKESE